MYHFEYAYTVGTTRPSAVSLWAIGVNPGTRVRTTPPTVPFTQYVDERVRTPERHRSRSVKSEGSLRNTKRKPTNTTPLSNARGTYTLEGCARTPPL